MANIVNPTEKQISWFKQKYIQKSKEECWDWNAYKTNKGYGQVKYSGVVIYAHRLAYYLANPNFDQNLQVLHRCDNPSCVNPDHMFLGTNQDNMNDKIKKQRTANGLSIGGWLSEEDVIKIRNLYSTGDYKQETLASIFKVDRSQISKIISGHRWRHLNLNQLA